ncbi:MAG: DUF1800 domain-containing protein [Rhodocyclaceae bacterium]|nr:DUF1800 domain-containing protein [Rhodocyclaceae bacterium]
MRRLITPLLVVLALFGPHLAAAAPTPAGMGVEDARHLLARAGFGAGSADLADFSRLGRQQAVEKLLAPVAALPADGAPGLDFVPPARFRDAGDADKKELQRRQFLDASELQAWWLGRMLAARPAEALQERMTLFWHNHFVSSLQKVRSPYLMLEQNRLLRRHALGNFGLLLHEIGKNPAMVVYLDAATNRKGQPNENFAREVMELFTLGEGHYSEQDVKEAARAFTGWSVEPETGAYKWRPFAHDTGSKTVLGKSGNFDGDDVLDILLARPETSERIVGKLWLEFISPTPEPAEVARLARILRESGYEMRSVLKALLTSRAFWAAENRGALVKSPVDLVVGTLRGLEVTSPDPLPFIFVLRQLGQDLFAPPNVKGWPGGETWINTNTLLGRNQFIERLLQAEASGGEARKIKPAMLRETFGKGANRLDDDNRQRLAQAINGIRVDSEAWFRRLADARLLPESALLAVAPTRTSKAELSNRERLRQWLLDPAYQVK